MSERTLVDIPSAMCVYFMEENATTPVVAIASGQSIFIYRFNSRRLMKQKFKTFL
jgi:hypothetical protein